jgi:hypothetical protein
LWTLYVVSREEEWLMNQENEEPRVAEPALTTGVMRGVDRIDSLGASPVPAGEPADEPAPYKKEPLFSKKVLIGWATATLIIWFGLTVIIPEIFRSIKVGIEESIADTPPGERILETPNGKLVITRTERGVTVETRRGRREIDLPARTAPVVAPAPPAPDPVPPPEATGKK